MTSETANKLKDAGYPYGWCSTDDCSCLSSPNPNAYCLPDFEDLLEKLDKHFRRLSKDGDFYITLGWSKDMMTEVASAETTPTEAMAVLWLKINT